MSSRVDGPAARRRVSVAGPHCEGTLQARDASPNARMLCVGGPTRGCPRLGTPPSRVVLRCDGAAFLGDEQPSTCFSGGRNPVSRRKWSASNTASMNARRERIGWRAAHSAHEDMAALRSVNATAVWAQERRGVARTRILSRRRCWFFVPAVFVLWFPVQRRQHNCRSVPFGIRRSSASRFSSSPGVDRFRAVAHEHESGCRHPAATRCHSHR